MDQTAPRRRAEGDEEALLFILAAIVGGVTFAVVKTVVAHGLIGETVGFFAMWIAIWPFVRRTWAAPMSWRHYLAFVVMTTAIGSALQIIFR